MIIPCFRCGKQLDTPDASNADYVIATDTIVKELKGVLFALVETQATKDKKAVKEEVLDSEYNTVELLDFKMPTTFGTDLVKVVEKQAEKDIQKTGVICPNCYQTSDFIIWGVHKK